MAANTDCKPVLIPQLFELFAQYSDGKLPNPSQGLELPNGKFFVCLECESSEAHKEFLINNAAVVQPRGDCNLSSVIAKFDGVKIQDMSKQDIVFSELLTSLKPVKADWFSFFQHLRLDYHTLKKIEKDYKDISDDCFREALAKWLDLATVKTMSNQKKQEKMSEVLTVIGNSAFAKRFKWPDV